MHFYMLVLYHEIMHLAILLTSLTWSDEIYSNWGCDQTPKHVSCPNENDTSSKWYLMLSLL